MQITIQAISFIVCAIVAIIILYQIFKRCQYTHSIVKYCFPFFPISRILRGTHRTLSVHGISNSLGTLINSSFVKACLLTDILLLRQLNKEKENDNTHMIISSCPNNRLFLFFNSYHAQTLFFFL